jgi:hypothetical protein
MRHSHFIPYKASMLSLIICSRDINVLAAVSKNVAETIGVPYEIVAIDNSKNKYTIFQAYNEGIEQSKYEFLCFMHEDISFKTAGWGRVVVESFENNKNLGILGVAGSSYKTFIPSGWIAAYAEKGVYVNLLQSFKDKREDLHAYANPRQEAYAKVISVDGVWFCTRKSIAEKTRFDDSTFKGFHCYDVDFSLNVGLQYDVAVTFDILINHFSEGSFDKDWATETLKLHKKWKSTLPLAAEQLPKGIRAELEFKAFHGILPKVLGNRYALLALLKDVASFKMISLLGMRKVSIMSALLIKKLLSAA